MAALLKSQDRLRIPEARFPQGEQVVLVQPQISADGLRPGRDPYHEATHKGKLLCPYCDLRVTFVNAAKRPCGGNISPVRDHFRAFKGHEEDCILPLALQRDHEGIEPDMNRGYRLHLNADFPGRVTATEPGRILYERNAEGRIIIRDPDLKLRERFSIAAVGDLMKFMRRGEFSRIQDSIVIRAESVVDWRNFLIHDRKQENRFQKLTDRLLNGVSQPCLMELQIHKPSESPVIGRAFKHGDLGYVMPRVYLDSKAAQGTMAASGTYLVLGVPRLSPRPNAQGQYFLNVSVTDPGQIAQVSLTTLAVKARSNAERREQRRLSPV